MKMKQFATFTKKKKMTKEQLEWLLKKLDEIALSKREPGVAEVLRIGEIKDLILEALTK